MEHIIALLQDVYNQLVNDALECNCSTWVDRAQVLIGIWATTVIAQSEIILRNSCWPRLFFTYTE